LSLCRTEAREYRLRRINARSRSRPRYLRFLLRSETDGLLLDESRPASRNPVIPESREIRTLLKVMIARGARRLRLSGDDPAKRADLVDLVR